MILIPKIIICCLVSLFAAYIIGRMIGLGIGVSLRNAQHKHH